MTDEETKAWMRENREGCEDAAQLAEHYCSEHDALDEDGDVPDEINALASEVWAEVPDADVDADESVEDFCDDDSGEDCDEDEE